MTFSLIWKQIRLSWIKHIFIVLKFQKKKTKQKQKGTLGKHGANTYLSDFITVQTIVLKFAALKLC